MQRQLTLKVKIHDGLTFQNFYAEGNQQLIAQLQHSAANLYLWGTKDCGKSHLLQACCNRALANNSAAIYIPCQEITAKLPQLLEDISLTSLICLDNIESLLGNKKNEEALFHTFNQINATNSRLLVTATAPPQQLATNLPDLKSRLCSLIVFKINSLSDEAKLKALQQYAKTSGLKLSTQVGNFLLTHYSRNLTQLFDILRKLEHASLIEQRQLTLPFVKSKLDFS